MLASHPKERTRTEGVSEQRIIRSEIRYEEDEDESQQTYIIFSSIILIK